MRLDNTQFLAQVGDILNKNSGKSSVYLTQKRLTPTLYRKETDINDLPSNVVDNPPHATNNIATYPLLIRISLNGSVKNDKKDKTKLSTVVENTDLDQFWSDYVQVIKAGFVGLKKKDKKKAKKSKVSKN